MNRMPRTRHPGRRLQYVCAMLCACFVTAGSARADSGQEGAQQPLKQNPTLADCLEYAALNNPGLEAAWSRWKAALEKAPQVGALPDPRLTYRYFLRRVETRVGPQRQSLGLAQTFPWFGKLSLRADRATAAAHTAYQCYEAEKLRLFYRVKDAHYEYYYLDRAIAVVKENLALMKYFEKVARTRYKVGAQTHSDVIRAQVELGKLDNRVRTLTDLREPIVARLNAALNRPAGADLPWPKSIPEERLEMRDEEILRLLRGTNPDLRALEHEITRQRLGIALARKNYFPDVTVGLDYIDTASARTGVSRSGRDPLIGMISINLPIWFGKYAAGVREAKARHFSALKARADSVNNLESAVKMVLYRVRDAERKTDLYRDTLVPKAKQSLKATGAAFRTGKATFLDLVDAERILLDFQLSYERALADSAQKLAELEMLVGRQLPRRHTERSESHEVPH